MPVATPSGRVIAARLVIAAALATALALLHGESLARLLLPLHEWMLGVLASEFRVLTLTLDTSGADRSIRAEVSLERLVVVAGQVYYPDARGRAAATTLAGNVVLMPVLVAALLAGLPATGWREALLRSLIALPLLVAAVAIDVPSVLAAELRGLFPGSETEVSPLRAWATFLQGGGRLALGLAIAGVTYGLARRWALRTAPDAPAAAPAPHAHTRRHGAAEAPPEKGKAARGRPFAPAGRGSTGA